jgi:UDP-N-acetylglucosamine transferase subunit ALG13
LRIGVPLVVVPNDGLLHGHQLELAVELTKQEYVVHGKLEYVSRYTNEIHIDEKAETFPRLYLTSRSSDYE